MYQRELENASGDSAEAEIRAKIAHLAAEKLGQPDKAIETWKVVLDLRGEDPEALHALADLYEGAAEWAKLVDILEREFDIASSDEDRVEHPHPSRAHDEREARSRRLPRSTTGTASSTSTTRTSSALRAIAGIRRRQGDPNELVAALHQLVDRAASFLEADELKEIFRELGKTYGRELQQPFDAAEAWTKLLDVGPDFEAMDALEAIYRADEKWTDVIDVKMRRAEALAEPAEQIEELRGVAALWREQVGDPDGARTAYEKILEIDPAHDEAFSELEKLHQASSRWEPLVELYLARLETREETSRQDRAPAQDRPRVRGEARRQEPGARRARQRAVDGLPRPRDRPVPGANGPGDRALGRGHPDGQRVAQAADRAQGEDPALPAPRQVVRRRPRAPRVRAALLRADHPARSAQRRRDAPAGEPLQEGRATGSRWGRRSRAPSTSRPTTSTARRSLNDLGELLDAQMQQTDQAIAYFQRALEVDPHFLPALENLERIYAARGQNRELVDVLQRKVPALQDPAETLAAKLRIAQLYETSLGDGVACGRRSTARSSTSSPRTSRACADSRVSTRRSSSGPTS